MGLWIQIRCRPRVQFSSESPAAGESFRLSCLVDSMLPQVEELATVVVCEDDDATRELLCDQLTADRYRALPAPSPGEHPEHHLERRRFHF
jgi:hypothetical protein